GIGVLGSIYGPTHRSPTTGPHFQDRLQLHDHLDGAIRRIDHARSAYRLVGRTVGLPGWGQCVELVGKLGDLYAPASRSPGWCRVRCLQHVTPGWCGRWGCGRGRDDADQSPVHRLLRGHGTLAGFTRDRVVDWALRCFSVPLRCTNRLDHPLAATAV